MNRRSMVVWVDDSPSQVAEHLKVAVLSDREFRIAQLDAEGGRLVGPANAAVLGRAIKLSFSEERGGTTVHASWRPWWPLQLLVWGQDDRDLGKLEKLLLHSS